MAKNPESKKTPPKGAANVRSDREKLLRALIVILLVMALSTGLILALAGLRRVLFSGNPRFQLREITVQTEGFWQGKAPQLASRLGIQTGDNIFALNPGELRKRLTAIPNVENCEVVRVLPDTLKLRVVERIPRAVLSNPRSKWVVDEDGVVIPRLESMSVSMALPVILGVPEKDLEPGMVLNELKPVLELIMQTVQNFPDINIFAINVRDPEKISIFLRFRSQKVCKVLMPAKSRNVNLLLTALQSAILHAERRGDTRGIFDLSFDGNVILR